MVHTQVEVIDSYSLFKPLFTSREHPKALLEHAGKIMISPESELGRLVASYKSETMQGSLEVCQAAFTDGALVRGKQGYGLFNPTRKRRFSDWEFELWENNRLLANIKQHLEKCVAGLPQAASLPKLACLALPSDPTSLDYMLGSHGMCCFGGTPGFIELRVLPVPGNLARLGAVLARAVVQNLRWQHFNGQPATLADHLVMEGLAAIFAAQLYPQTPGYAWLFPFAAPGDWDEVLIKVAGFYGLKNYEQVPTNLYGGKENPDSFRLPQLQPMTEEELNYALEVTHEALSATDAHTIAAYLYGDPIMVRQGHPTVGLPTYAGFELGYHLVQNRLRTGKQALDELLLTPTVQFFEEEALTGK
jgi:uncharacterized protein YjaZ